MVTNPGRYNQKITLGALEHRDFALQMKSQPKVMDLFCGDGFQELYDSITDDILDENATFLQRLLDDLMLFCLFNTGRGNGYIKPELNVTNTIVRGTMGVAAQYVNSKRIHSGFLILPILSLQQMRQNTLRQPSTMLPSRVMKYLTMNSTLLNIHNQQQMDEHVQKYEEFLYEVIASSSEAPSWVIFNAACNDATRKSVQNDQRLIATACQEPKNDHDCCSFYDPDMKPFVRRSRDTAK
jgi:hypothetical protein